VGAVIVMECTGCGLIIKGYKRDQLRQRMEHHTTNVEKDQLDTFDAIEPKNKTVEVMVVGEEETEVGTESSAYNHDAAGKTGAFVEVGGIRSTPPDVESPLPCQCPRRTFTEPPDTIPVTPVKRAGEFVHSS
jgi:hypothetical protein